MDDEAALDTTDLRFIVAVRDQAHLELALKNLRRTQAVIRAARITPQA
jgi:GTP pyrophosphokinase